jgi:hypothetical protein
VVLHCGPLVRILSDFWHSSIQHNCNREYEQYVRMCESVGGL